MTSRLALYNGALQIIGERHLASLTEDREPRYLLDDVWNNGGVRFCLEQGNWRFASRSVRLDYDPAIAPEFGYRRAFAKATDWVNTVAVCQDEFYRVPLIRYKDEAGYLFADLDEIFCTYISDDASFGQNLATWPESFREYVETHFAGKIVRKLTAEERKVDQILHPRSGALVRALRNAKNKTAQLDGTKFLAQGSWTRARQGYGKRGPLGDGGSSGSLTG